MMYHLGIKSISEGQTGELCCWIQPNVLVSNARILFLVWQLNVASHDTRMSTVYSVSVQQMLTQTHKKFKGSLWFTTSANNGSQQLIQLWEKNNYSHFPRQLTSPLLLKLFHVVFLPCKHVTSGRFCCPIHFSIWHFFTFFFPHFTFSLTIGLCSASAVYKGADWWVVVYLFCLLCLKEVVQSLLYAVLVLPYCRATYKIVTSQLSNLTYIFL